jgi:hypothetical protein
MRWLLRAMAALGPFGGAPVGPEYSAVVPRRLPPTAGDADRPEAAAGRKQTDVRWRLGAKTYKSVLLVHIAAAGAWLGIDVVMAVFVVAAVLTADDGVKALSFRALELFAPRTLFATGTVCLLSGVVLGLGSRYGLVRYWWVAAKLVLNLVLTGLVPLALSPGLFEAATQARQFLAGAPATLAVGDLIYPPMVSPAALLVAMVLAVFKPWGRIPWPRARPASTRKRQPNDEE